jgi:CHAT domain-containing protein
VVLVEGRTVKVEGDSQGLVIWSEGTNERWEFISSNWRMPAPSITGADVSSPIALARSRGAGGEAGGDLGLLTTQLEQLKGESILRDGAVLTPFSNSRLLNPRITIRRKPGHKLPAVVAIISRDGKEVAQLPLGQGQTTVSWDKVAGLSKEGLAPGTFSLQIRPGIDRVMFTVEESTRQLTVMKRSDELARLLQIRKHPLYVQVAVDNLLAPIPPYLADALDALEELPEESRTPHLRQLYQDILKRLEDPGATPAIIAPLGEATQIPGIDKARDLIARGQWAKADKILNSIHPDSSPSAGRTRGMIFLYRGVIYAEAGPGKEQESDSAFQSAIHELDGGLVEDLYRAHNNYANFLLGRAQDQLHNHAFQMATHARQPFLNILANWSAAEHHYQKALELSGPLGPNQVSAVRVNLSRLYVLLADVIRTLDAPTNTGRRFVLGEKAATEQARQLAVQASDTNERKSADLMIRAVAEELQAHVAFREMDVASCLAHAESALRAYIDAGSLTGAESAHRLLGLCHRRVAQSANDPASRGPPRQTALRHFLIAHTLAEVLRERFPPDRYGMSRAGFFARRAYVNEMIIELLLAEGKDAAALHYAEQAKARALQDLLTTEGCAAARTETRQSVEELLKAWPKNMVALEYFLGSERAWVFVVNTEGKVSAFVLTGTDGNPLGPRDLVSQVQHFLDATGAQAPKMYQRLTSGKGLDNSWQDTLHAFYQELIPEPARGELRRAKTVLVVPHHILHYFPFAALVTKQDTEKRTNMEIVKPRFLIDEPVDLCYAPSLNSWNSARQRVVRPITQVSGLAIPDLPGVPPPLEGVKEDVKNLQAAFGDRIQTVYVGETAHTDNARILLQKPGLLLFAMHGKNEPDRPLKSHLHLYPGAEDEGEMTADQVYASRVETDLVVMSACYSGLADRSPLPGDDLFGLQRAFLQAGARTVVSGLWDVYDGTGPDLMRGLFENLVAGKSAPAALAASQRAFLNRLRASNEVEFFLHP